MESNVQQWLDNYNELLTKLKDIQFKYDEFQEAIEHFTEEMKKKWAKYARASS